MEAFFLMGIARLAIVFFPFRKIASFMGKQMSESPAQVEEGIYSKAVQVRWSIQKMSTRTPWESKCLVQALTAQVMLKRRIVPTTLYLGIAKDGTNKLLAHAWLRCGELTVTGDLGREKFKSVAHFACLPKAGRS